MEKITSYDFKCNILMMGKSGSGKSSFCNYIFQNPDLFKTGKGKPVTSWEDNFQSKLFHINSIPTEIFDTVGIEVTNYERWNEELQNFLKNHSIDQEDANNWLHAVFYVINAASDRVEVVEKKVIKNLLTKHSLPLQIILTNCDAAKPEQISAMKNELYSIDSTICVNEVNSVTQRFRVKTEVAFGREDVLKIFLNQSYDYIGEKVAFKALKILEKSLSMAKNELLNTIDSIDFSIINSDTIESMFDEMSQKLDLTLDKFIEEYIYFEKYHDFMESFDIDSTGLDKFDAIENLFENLLENMNSNLMIKLEKSLEYLEEGGFVSKFEAEFILFKNALTLKLLFKKIINEFFDKILQFIQLGKGFIWF